MTLLAAATMTGYWTGETGGATMKVGFVYSEDESTPYTANFVQAQRVLEEKYGDRIAVGVDIRDGFVAIRGWTEKSAEDAMGFCRRMEEMGVSTLIVTDISRDGAMKGTNRKLYERLCRDFDLQITASGGVSDMDDVRALASMGLYGAIIGKAYYTGAIDLAEAVSLGKASELR